MERGLQTLLDLSAQESADQPWPRVHAINTLRLCFMESALAHEASPFCSRGALATACCAAVVWTRQTTVAAGGCLPTSAPWRSTCLAAEGVAGA